MINKFEFFIHINAFLRQTINKTMTRPNHAPDGDNLVKGVQCYELFGGIAFKNHIFNFFFITYVQ